MTEKRVAFVVRMRILDLFCGCGGFSTGLEKAGHQIVAGIDVWDTAIMSYKQNHKNTIALCRDIKEYPPEALVQEHPAVLQSIDMIVGGPPCQGFSMAGKRDPSDPRNSLFMEFARYIKYFRPRYFVMENVAGILSMKTKEGERVLDIIMETFKAEGYHVKYQILKASDYGVPQIRRRVFFLGSLSLDSINFPEPTTSENPPAIGPYLTPEEHADPKLFLSQRALDGIARKKIEMQRKGNGFGAQFLDFNKPCYTIPARYWKDGYDALVKYESGRVRRLSVAELKRVQSFPDDYVLVGSKKDQIMQIGNAVASHLAYHIGRCFH